MAKPLVTFALEGGVALIGLDRPEKRNAISDALLAELAAAVARANSEAKAAVIHGHGAHFSAGLDLAEHAAKSPGEGLAGSRGWHAAFDRIERGAIPFIAALHGAVVGGGLELAAATHIRVADRTAFYALPEGRRGIFVGGGGSVRIARLITVTRMIDLMLTGRVWSAEEGERFNLVHYLVEPGAALDKAKEIARTAADNAPLSNYFVINALSRIQDMAREDGLFVESVIAAFTQTSPEAAERMKAFVEKRARPLATPGKGG
jgi:enoyl-CoA hydratase/carnithine racemase